MPLTDLLGTYGTAVAVSAAIFGPLTGWFAGRRDRHPVVWLAFGALLGPLAIGILALAPPGRCPLCDTPVEGWASFCTACGGPLTFRARSGDRWQRPVERRAPVPPATAEVAAPLRPFSVEPPDLASGRVAPIARPADSAASDSADRSWGTTSPPVPFDSRGRSADRVARGPDDSEILATGVYFGGSASLVVGARYVITRHGPMLRILGPIEQDPTRVALERPLDRLTATAVGERLVITEGSADRVSLALALGAFAGASSPQLEAILTEMDGPAADRMPAS
jgi:hypothetical protein